MAQGYTKSALENRVAKYYEDHYAETFPAGGAKRPVSIKDLDPVLLAFEHRLRGRGHSEALKNLNNIDSSLLSWGHYQRLVDMRRALENDGVGDRLTDEERGRNLARLGITYLYMADRANAETFLAKAVSIADKCGDAENAGLWSVYRALNLIIGGDLETARTCIDSARKKVKDSLNLAFLNGVEGYIRIGVLGYHDVMQSKEMLESYNEAVRLYAQTPVQKLDFETRSLRTFIHLHRARSYSVLGQHAAAQPDFEEARKEYEALDNQRVLVYWHTIRGSAEREMGKFGQAKSALEHAQRVSIAIGDRRGEQITNSLLGKVYRDAAWAIRIRDGEFNAPAVEHLHAAAHYFDQALTLERALGNRPRLTIVLRRLGNVHRALSRAAKDNKAAKDFARLAEENYTEATAVASEGLPAPDARTTIYDWLERSRLALAAPTAAKAPDAQAALDAQQELLSEGSAPVIPVVEMTMGIVLLGNRNAYKSEKHGIDSAQKAFDGAKELLDRALAALVADEKGRKKSEKDLKRWAEIGHAIGTALVGQAVSAAGKGGGDLENRALDKYREVLDTYRSPGFVRDTYRDLISIGEAVGPSPFVDKCLALFRDNWEPESL